MLNRATVDESFQFEIIKKTDNKCEYVLELKCMKSCLKTHDDGKDKKS